MDLTDVVAYDNDYHSQFVKYPRPAHPTRKYNTVTQPWGCEGDHELKNVHH